MNEVEQFLKDTESDPIKVDVLEQPLIPTPAKDEGGEESDGASDGDDGENSEMKPRNRRERRLSAALEAERESSAFLAGKLAARSEAEKALSEEADYLKAVERIYGTDSPEAQLATDLLKKAIVGARDDAEQRAYARMMDERAEQAAAVEEADGELDSMIEEIEEEYGINLNQQQETAFFKLLERMSPKDRDGNVVEYADPHAVWEVFSERTNRRSPESNRAKDLSSRSMVNSGASKESNLNDDVAARFLKEQGII